MDAANARRGCVVRALRGSTSFLTSHGLTVTDPSPPGSQDAAAHGRELEEEDEGKDLDDGGRARSRLVWTPELHERFMNAVNHLGVKHAVPKTILQLMNVEGLTRENVASHLQVLPASGSFRSSYSCLMQLLLRSCHCCARGFRWL